MYKCVECGNLFEEGEQSVSEEKIGVCFGFPAYEKHSSCPYCGGNYEVAQRCKICDEWDILYDGFCDECKKYYKRDFKNLMSKTYTEEERELINIIFEGELL